MSAHRYCVCVPARNEADRLPILLDALARQDVAGTIAVALCINNTADDSMEVVARAGDRWAGRLTLAVEECHLPPERAHAGTARGRAMDLGVTCVDAQYGVLIATDADCRPPVDWIARTLAAIDAGADMVGGRIVLDEAEPVSPGVAAMRETLDRYWHVVRGIEDAIDPSAWDRPPRHGDHTGASLAITAALYARVGGVPPIPTGEDRALVAAGIAAGGRLVHPAGVWTRVSPRTTGRAAGGMAEHMAALDEVVARGAPTLVPSFDQWRARAAWRRALRQQPGGDARVVEEEAALPPMRCDMPLGVPA